MVVQHMLHDLVRIRVEWTFSTVINILSDKCLSMIHTSFKHSSRISGMIKNGATLNENKRALLIIFSYAA